MLLVQGEQIIKEILKGARIVADIGLDAMIDEELDEMEQDSSVEQ